MDHYVYDYYDCYSEQYHFWMTSPITSATTTTDTLNQGDVHCKANSQIAAETTIYHLFQRHSYVRNEYCSGSSFFIRGSKNFLLYSNTQIYRDRQTHTVRINRSEIKILSHLILVSISGRFCCQTRNVIL